MSDTAALSLAPQAVAPRTARRWACERALELGVPDLADDVALLTTEVVTNAVLHAGTPVTVSVRREGRGVRVEVRDGSRVAPSRRLAYSRTATTGRGSMLLDQLATRWGSTVEPDGKVVWFVVEPAAAGGGGTAGRSRLGRRGPTTVDGLERWGT